MRIGRMLRYVLCGALLACGGDGSGKVADSGVVFDVNGAPDGPGGPADGSPPDRAPQPQPDGSPAVPDGAPGPIDAAPVEIDAGPPGSGVIGEPCSSASDCLGDTCLTAASGWPMGYCSDLGCSTADPITSCAPFGGDGVCVSFGGMTACFDRCPGGTADCRAGYTCLAFSPAALFCIPE